MAREEGVVKWFDNQKGYGFIEREEGEDVFVHYNDVQGEGYRSLREGEKVEFDVVQDPKGLRAENVERLGHEGPATVVKAQGDVRTLSESRAQFRAERERLARRLEERREDESDEEER